MRDKVIIDDCKFSYKERLKRHLKLVNKLCRISQQIDYPYRAEG